MENQNKDESIKKEEKEEKIPFREEIIKDKKAQVAKDLVVLKHVEVKKQEVSKETADLADTLKQQILEHDRFEKLSNDELTILETFMTPRLFLSRIAIIANQSRIPLGIEPFKKNELELFLNSLMEKGYINSEMVGDKMVYILTERGKYRIQ